MRTCMDHLRLREQEREQREQREERELREQREEREGKGESESTVDRLVCLAADDRDSSADDSASAASTTQLFVTIFAPDGAWLKILYAMLLEQEGQEL